MHMRLASPFRKGEGEGEGFRKSRVCEFQTPHLNPLPCFKGEAGKTRCGFVCIGAGFIKVPEMDPIALLLKRPFQIGVC
jgi:hypothetical protein